MMFKKRYLVMLLFLIICAMTISQASAADINATDELAGDVVNDEIMTNVANEGISSDLNNKEIASETENDEIAVSNESDSVSVTGYGTFTELNNLIKNAGTSLTLDKDYMFDPDTDNVGTLKQGLDLNKDIMIYGNGHTLYGNGARIMWIYSSSLVYIQDLHFENSFNSSHWNDDNVDHQTSGGAIYNNGMLFLEGCTFTNNLADYGGAIYCSRSSILYAQKCNFTLNFANEYGGAIYNNGISYILGDSDATPTSSASLLRDYSWFMGNMAIRGGAIYSTSDLGVSHSIFTINLAGYGGAIYNTNVSCVENSILMNNTATSQGGATYDTIVKKSTFSVNSASSGMDMYKGVSIDNTFSQSGSNRAVNVVKTTELVSSSNTLKYTTIAAGNKFKVVVTSKSGDDKIKGVKVKLTLDDNTNTTVITDSNGEATFTLPALTYGSHKYKVTLINFDSGKDYTVSIAQGKSTIKFGKDTLKYVYGKTGSVSVTVTGGTLQKSNIKILGYGGNPSITLTSNYVIKVSNLPVGTYTLSVKTTPDDSHSEATKSIPIKVVKPTAKITASKMITTYNSGKKFTATLKDTTNNNRAMSNAVVIFKVYTGGSAKTYKTRTNSNGVATFKDASKLSPGTHKVIVSYSNSKYSCKSVTTSIVVNKKALKITAIAKRYTNCGEVHVKVSDGSKPLNKIKVSLKVYTGGSYRNFNLITGFDGKRYFSDGWVLISSNAFSVGNHPVKISIVSPYYKGTASSYLIIPASSKKSPSYTGVMSNGRTFKV